MLIDGRNFWKLHSRWLLGALVAMLIAIAVTIWASLRTGRWPGGGSPTGLVLGTIAGLIFLFELALVAKKTKAFRAARWTLSTQIWMKAHIWLGLLSVPLIALHSGGRVGGTLTTVFVLVFSVVIVSGIWGLVVQNLLPRWMLDAAPVETVYSQIERVGRQYAAEARRLVLLACGEEDEQYDSESALSAAAAVTRQGHVHGAARQVGAQIKRSPHPAANLQQTVSSPAIQTALLRDIGPYLDTGKSDHGLLGTRQRNGWYFEDLRLRVEPQLRSLVNQLEELCERRRQLGVQKRIHFWLHNWLWLHLPLSIALILLLVGHVIFALRFG